MKSETPTNPKGLPGAQVTRVAEFVNYQDCAIVSREVIKKPAGSRTDLECMISGSVSGISRLRKD